MEGGEITDLQSDLIEYEGDSSDEFDGGTSGEGCWRTEVIEEGKHLLLAGPLVAVSMLQRCLVLSCVCFFYLILNRIFLSLMLNNTYSIKY